MKKFLALFILLLAGSVGMMAQTTFISNLCVINVDSKSDTAAVLTNARSKGWKILLNASNKPADFSENAGSASWYIFIGYTTTTDYAAAIKTIVARASSTTAPTAYTIVPAFANTSGKGKACTANLNEGKGTPIYLFTTKSATDGAAAVTSLSRVGPQGSASNNSSYVKDYDTNAAMDFLKGTSSGSYIYLNVLNHNHNFAWQKVDATNCYRYCRTCNYKGANTKHDNHYESVNDEQCRRVCSHCGYVSLTVAHDYTNGTKTDDGHCKSTCSRCSHAITRTHKYGAWVFESAFPDKHMHACEYCGDKKYESHNNHLEGVESGHQNVCSVCSYKSPIYNHAWVTDAPAVPSTCTTAGTTARKHCSVCNYASGGTATALKAHAFTTIPAKGATCVEEGRLSHKRCQTCDGLFDASGNATTAAALAIPIDPDGHKKEYVAENSSTCTAPGTSVHKECAYCHKIYSYSDDSEEVTMDDLYIPPHFSNSRFYDAVAPTCQSKGSIAYYTCSGCKKNYVLNGRDMEEVTAEEIAIDMVDHDWHIIAAMPTSGGTMPEHERCQYCLKFVCPNDSHISTTDFSGILAGKGTEDEPYLVSSSNDLYAMGVRYDHLSEVYSQENIQRHFRMTNNITVSGTYLPISGTQSKSSARIPFFDVFDGAFHTITFDNAVIDDAGYYAGVFGYVGTYQYKMYGSVKNLSVRGQLQSSDNSRYVGAVCGYMERTSIENCHNYASLTVTSKSTGCFGGVAGYASSEIPLIGCSNHGELSLTDYNNNLDTHAIGGIVGHASGTIQDCLNTGAINVYSAKKCFIYGIGSSTAVNCINTGMLKFRSSYRTDTQVYGIAKKATNCFNSSQIVINDNAGGIYHVKDLYAICSDSESSTGNFFAGSVYAPEVNHQTLDPEGTYTVVTLTDGGVDDVTLSSLNSWVGNNSTAARSYDLWTRNEDGLPAFTWQMGDQNNDGVISISDLPSLIDLLRGVYTRHTRWSVDVNGDGLASPADVEALTDRLLEK